MHDVPIAEQRILRSGVPLPMQQRIELPLKQFNFYDGELLQLERLTAAASSNSSSSSAPTTTTSSAAPTTGGVQADSLLQAIQSATSASAAGTTNNNNSSAAGDDQLLRLFGNQNQNQNQNQHVDPRVLQLFGGGGQQQQQQQRRPQQMPLDENDPEVQKRLLEQIKQENIQRNYLSAMENTPEAFARVTMLYVKAEINNVEHVMFVDSGAEMSIISQKAAERHNISYLIDTRFQGMAQGVGTQKIIGRIHAVKVKIAGVFMQMSFTVMEKNNMDLLLGLDQLRHHQMCIDLKKNKLVLDDDHSVDFIAEGDVPKEVNMQREKSEGGGGETKEGEEGEAAVKKDASSERHDNNEEEKQKAATSGGGEEKKSNQQEQTQQDSAPSQQSGSSSSSTALQLTKEQEEHVARLVEAFKCPKQIAVEALLAANWNDEEAGSLVLAMMDP